MKEGSQVLVSCSAFMCSVLPILKQHVLQRSVLTCQEGIGMSYLSASIKISTHAKPFIWKLVFFHMNGFA